MISTAIPGAATLFRGRLSTVGGRAQSPLPLSSIDLGSGPWLVACLENPDQPYRLENSVTPHLTRISDLSPCPVPVLAVDCYGYLPAFSSSPVAQDDPARRQLTVMDRYISWELTLPFLFGVGAFSSIGISIGALFELIRQVTNAGLSMALAIEIFVLKLPEFIVLAFPMATLLATMMTYSRFSSDSELIAPAGVRCQRAADHCPCDRPQPGGHGHDLRL
jgi:hypothetical protein